MDGTGAGNFKSNISNLEPGTNYHVRAFATNSKGTSYGSTYSFKTIDPPSVPTVTTTEVTGITQTSAVSGGTVINDGDKNGIYVIKKDSVKGLYIDGCKLAESEVVAAELNRMEKYKK